MPSAKEIMTMVSDLLLENGPMKKPEIRLAFPELKDWEVNNAIGYLGCLSVKGKKAFSAAMIYHPNDPSITDDMRPEVELWLRRVFTKYSKVRSTQLVAVSQKRGYSKSSFDQACIRMGLRSVRLNDGNWARVWPEDRRG